MLNINAELNENLLESMGRAVVRAIGPTNATQDIVQDAVVRILANVATFDPERGSFSSWALRIVSNVARNWRKACANRGHVSEMSDDDGNTSALVETIGADQATMGHVVGPDGRQEIQRTEDAQALARALGRLEDDERRFILAINGGMGQTEAGALVGWSPATATRRRKAIAASVAKYL